MHDFMKTILLAIKEWVNKRIKNNTPNWNENDPEADGYIKNRPFYAEEKIQELVNEKNLVTEEDGGYCEMSSEIIFVPGKTYQVILNDVAYECVAWNGSDGESKCIGNGDIYGGEGLGEKVPFSCDSYDDGKCFLNTETAGLYSLIVLGMENSITKIDEKYLPSNLARSEELLELREYTGYLDDLLRSTVSYTPQNFNASLKKIARNNIDAVSTEEAIIYSDISQETVTWDGNTTGTTSMSFNGDLYYLIPEAPIYSFDQLATNSVQATLSNGTTRIHTAYEGVNKCYSLGTSAETIVVVEVPKTSCSLPNYYGSSRSTVFVPKVAGVYTRGGSPYWTSFTYSAKNKGVNIYMPTHETGTKFPVKLNENGTFFEEHIPNTIARTSEIPSTEGLATETYVNNKVAGLVDSAPETLDTLNELAAALGDDPNFATTVATKLGELETAVDNFEIPNSNLVNGSAEGSLRTIRSMQEDLNYTMGPHAFAEGDLTMAEGNSSHAEGYCTKAFGETCHVEGNGTSADGACSHAEGYMSSVEGFGAHAEGFATCAYGRGQHVEGEFNIPDEVDEVRDRGQYLHIAGNGSWDDQTESNAYTLDWSGNGWFSGDVYVGSTSGTNRDEGSKKLATEEYVDNAAVSIDATLTIEGAAADAGAVGDALAGIVSFTPSLTSGTEIGTITINGTATKLYCNNDNKVTNTLSTSTKFYVTGTNSASTNTGTQYFDTGVYVDTTAGKLVATQVQGAVWNDYAEYRITEHEIEPGRIVVENGDDTLSLASERLMPGANVVSDTYGFVIGETEQAKTPIAVSGRALVYTFEERETFKAGDPVCSGPNGTVSKMTREEVMMYPERIIGTVSAIPSYKEWGTNKVQINNRIWISIK